jgi:hypothetical protein
VSSSLPVQVDYTSRDYQSLREDLISRIQANIPEWDADDPADFGVALVEAFAYMGDLMSYYIDRAANESSLSTATRRASVVALARDLGYEASGYVSATAAVTVVNEADRAISLPKGTVLTASVDANDVQLSIPFETTEELTVASTATAIVTCVQGITQRGTNGVGEALGLSTGLPGQIFEVPDSRVLKESVQVYVFDGVNYVPWKQVDHIVDYSPLSKVYTVREADIDTVFVEFGDGTSGLIPTSGHGIFAEYRLSDGTLGNVPAGKITQITQVPLLTPSELAILNGFVSVINDTPSVGGSDPEDVESIRFNAAQAFRANSRAVTLDDFQSLALRVSSVGKASAFSETPASILLAVAPFRSFGTAEERPGYLFDEVAEEFIVSEELTTTQTKVFEDVSRAALAGTTLTMIDPVYVPIEIEISAVGIASLRVVDVFRVIKDAITERMDYSRIPFGAVITDADITALVTSLGVTRQMSVDVLRRVGDESSGGVIQADADEIFILREDDLTILVSGGLEEEL